ncbi:hypothetical protein J4Y14_17470, partial [Escherichia coli]
TISFISIKIRKACGNVRIKLSVMIINRLQTNKKQSEAGSETSSSVILMMLLCSSYHEGNN